ncbi:MAG: diguanylate cyclase [Gallionella sp.]|nr:diguanylate cyclase [Gallionella sp.]MDP1940887.1 diguanylate cyclase [Gallionella sp.]
MNNLLDQLKSMTAIVADTMALNLYVRLFLPLTMLLVGGAAFIGNQEIERELAKLRYQEAGNIELGASALTGKLDAINHDLLFLSTHSALRKAVNHPVPGNVTHLAEDFAIFSASRGWYDQIRWIDEGGMEVVRVDYVQGRSVIVATEKLQNKGGRYFFSDTLKLQPGEIFVSPLDLNIEQNKIESPYKPMLRIATPVFDQQGRKRGIVILNYYGSDLLQAYAKATANLAGKNMVINADGYWLKSPEPSDEWGFMFKRTELSMGVRAPAAWKGIRSADKGQFELDDGLWTWETVYPLQAGQKSTTGAIEASEPSRGKMESRQYFWKSVSYLPAATLDALRQAIWLKVVGVTSLLLCLLWMGSWLLARSWSQLATEKIKYRAIADFTYDWETWIDPNGNYIYCSPSCVRIAGREVGAFMADPDLFLNIVHPDDRARLAMHLQHHGATDEACEFELRILLPDGQVRWLEHTCQPVFDEAGHFLGRRASNRDITNRKLAEKEQEEMRRNQRALLNAIQESTFLMDMDGTIRVMNQVAAQRLNAVPESLIGKNMFEIIPPLLAQSRKAMFEQVAQSGKPATIEDERDGRCFLNSIYPVLDSNGAVRRFAVYAADVTQQRRQQGIDDALSAISQEVLQGVALHEVLLSICQKVAELFRLEVVWLGRKETGGEVSVLAAAGSATQYVEQLKLKGVRWDDTSKGRGPSGSAIRFGKTQVFRVDDPHFQIWAKIAMEHGLRSIIAMPLVIRGEVYGAFTLYSSNPVLFDSTSLTDLLSSIGRRICVLLEAAMDQQRVRLLSSALEAAGSGVMITDPQGRIQWANHAFSNLCGYSAQDLAGQTPRILKSGQQAPEYYQALWATIGRGELWSSETVERAKNGTFYTVSQTITPIFSDGEISHFIAIHEDISAQKLTQERIEHLAHYDALTGLPNRTLFFDRLRQALSLARRNESGLALLYMDLDGFKQVNDRMGHHAGDMLLSSVANRLLGCTRASDTVARLGGDEFTVILGDTHRHEDVAEVAQKIISAISAPFDLEEGEARIGISIGIACYSEEAANENELMRYADQAMYLAKSAGKNTFRFGSCNPEGVN